VLRAIGDAVFDPKRLTIEITETTLMSDPERAAIGLSQLDAFGVRISLDDFGTGQTSLGYLSSLPIDELKVDRSFVGNMVSDRSSAAIVRSIIDLGHNLRLRVVAEGIEQRDVLTALLDVGCDEGQGFLFARPMPAADLNRFLSITPTFTAEDLPWERRS
jgi:EAL domain-containing protein (putative c-di-GMP-specific phosphodiesterase class I)